MGSGGVRWRKGGEGFSPGAGFPSPVFFRWVGARGVDPPQPFFQLWSSVSGTDLRGAAAAEAATSVAGSAAAAGG
jgi:hypothetical protein